ncbi:hypothetical protein M1843_09100 [Isoptericola sp. 4D.3]|jgi:hypothetical protein|uniref:Uncharacterized protein n=1 Tax=Isoptericola peretonis TaxID=2918523 RepID=A0ABT0J320_9MICO|nr:hypothetical protein [Isoptericola sp. 4D.3]
MDRKTSQDLAVLAELDYRRERIAETYGRGVPAPVRAVGRWAAAAVRRVRDHETVQRLGSTIDAVAARTDAEAWDRQVTRRAEQIAHGLDALRPQDGAGRRAA